MCHIRNIYIVYVIDECLQMSAFTTRQCVTVKTAQCPMPAAAHTWTTTDLHPSQHDPACADPDDDATWRLGAHTAGAGARRAARRGADDDDDNDTDNGNANDNPPEFCDGVDVFDSAASDTHTHACAVFIHACLPAPWVVMPRGSR